MDIVMVKIIKRLVVLSLVTVTFNAIAIGFTITDLGAARESVVINNSGQIAGSDFFYENGIRTNLLLEKNSSISSWFRTRDINEKGLVVGGALVGGRNIAFTYDGASIQYLGSLGGLFPSSFATGVNDLGQVVGNSSCDKNTVSPNCAFIYENGEMNEMEGNLNPAQDRISNFAISINNRGAIVGSSFNVPFIYENGVMSELLLNAGSRVSNISNSGRIIGSNNLTKDAFIYDENGLISFSVDSALFTSASSLNELNQVVGHYLFDSGEVDEYDQPVAGVSAYLFSEENGVVDLFSSLTGNVTGWDSLEFASDINDNGDIVGIGMFNGERHAYLLTAVPLPAALYLFSTGLFSLFGVSQYKAVRKKLII